MLSLDTKGNTQYEAWNLRIKQSSYNFKTVDALQFEPDINKALIKKIGKRLWKQEAREGFYQTQLKTLERYGGMNTLDSNDILF